MRPLLTNPIHRTWLFLVIATLTTAGIGESGASGQGIALSLFIIAIAKGRLVILDFMELRQAPRLWRLLLEGWLLAVSLLILIAYRISLTH